MEKEIERLQTLLGDQDVWQRSTESEGLFRLKLDPTVGSGIYTESHDDENMRSVDNRVVGRLEDAIRYDQVGDFPLYRLQIGQQAPVGELFCTLRALAQYPYKYICAASRERVVKKFFAMGKLYERVWDFFYIYPPPSISHRPIILVPSSQLQHFLATVNDKLHTCLKLPDSAMESGLIMDFPVDGTPRPRYLGRTDERELVGGLKQAIPSVSYKPDSEGDVGCEPTEQSKEAFKKKMELLIENDKKKKATNREKKEAERFAKQRAFNHSIKRVQRYLGIQRTCRNPVEVKMVVGQSLKDSDLHFADYAGIPQNTAAVLENTEMLDVNDPASFIREDSIVFICVDVEAFERDHNLITEIGIATLDTADISAIPMGKDGTNWMKAIRARHFRVKEYEHLKNTDFLKGCPEYFQFGKSEWISIKEAPQQISTCFKPPYSKHITTSISKEETDPEERELDQKRNIILVGHDVATDINYLRKLGYDPYNLSNLQELIDTSSMYRALERELNPRNLGSILASLDIPGWYLHNAGNDAVYTLQAMISIAVKALLEKRDEETHEKESKSRIAESIKMAADVA